MQLADIIQPMSRPDKNLKIDQALDIMASSAIKPAADGTKSFRFVMRLLRGNITTPYVVHMETDPFSDKSGYHHGIYCANMLEAYMNLKLRTEREGLALLDFNHRRVIHPRS